MPSGLAFVAGVQPAIVDEALAIAAWETIARRAIRDPGRRALFPIEQAPYLLRHVLLCGKCSGPMTTCASQAVTIHPFLDGNGRIGRLLIALLLEHWKLLREPLLYLSLFFKQHRAEYYRRLDGVRGQGDFEGWLAFFLEGTAGVAEEAVGTVQDLFSLITSDRAKVLSARTTSVTAARLLELLPENPIVTIGRVVDLLSTTKPTANKAVSALVDAGVLVETTGRRRDRTFGYAAYLDRLRAGTGI